MLIDCHCHLDLYREPAIVAGSLRSEECLVLSVTTTPSAWRGTSALGSGIPGVHTGLGLHPQLAGERASELGLMESLVPAAEFVGEVGLDGTPELRQSWPTQTRLFDAVLASATRAGGRVLSIHSRRAAGEVAARLQAFPDAGTPILHWFSGSLKELQLAVEIGCWFSVGPAMLRSKRGRGLIERMPRDRVLPETDGPFARDTSGQPLQPTGAREVQAGVAEMWGEPADVVTARMDEGAAVIRGRMHEVSAPLPPRYRS
ncbi:Qat anti-phage system TatD family nuclease QatD [Engelhardtia mirabilis]|uniref:Putative deoxyribonuclease YjjV n=1 Tax=Engelhardtia mirabilis TaxID=2528011 RepID=A0A518BE93_9BACT|nr:putative deoxyribonuclease YjjV [Planctomycetes bacterium Pla133]QDU99617.1 putative deoxyribonuclease YjjV [Planctomycetes bacterium Pla86]